MATGIRIHLGGGPPLPIVYDEPLGIEHAEDGHVAFGHLLGDEILVASEFSTMVATHRFVEGRGVGVRGQTYGGIQNAVMRVRIFEDEEVRGGGFLLFGQIPFGNQIVFAQLILVKAPEVDQNKEPQRNGQVFHFDLPRDVQPNGRGGQHNKD